VAAANGYAFVEAVAAHPILLRVDDDLRRPRLLVFFRILLALPHLVWLALWTIVALPTAVLNWFATLFRGAPPRAFHRFLSAYVRYGLHVFAFLYLIGNPFPGFTGAHGTYPVDIELPEPSRQSRWRTGFRIFLAIPALLVNGALGSASFAAAILLWFVSLFTGRAAAGLRNLGAYALRYQAQVNANLYLLTERYPHASPLEGRGETGGSEGEEPLPQSTSRPPSAG
jgi:hypothetical protein